MNETIIKQYDSHNYMEDYNPKVSIIIPVYNGGRYLQECIDSALGQDYRNIEVIIVNDGSNDFGQTEKIAQLYADKVTYVSKDNGGVSSALNVGLKHMNGEYFSWLSHDDLYETNKISRQIDIIKKNKFKDMIVFSNSILVNEKGDYIGKSRRRFKSGYYEGEEIFRLLLNGKTINGCTLLIPKRVFDITEGFDEKLNYIQDFKMWLLLAFQDFTYFSIQDNLVRMRVHDQQQTLLIKEKYTTEVKFLLEDFFELLLNNPKTHKSKILHLLDYSILTGNSFFSKKILKFILEQNLITKFERTTIFFKRPKIVIKRFIYKNLRLLLNILRRKRYR